MLVDHAKIYVSGGNGGDGCNSFYKDLFHRKGIPDGGDGGDGGDVVIESDPNLQTLLDFKYNQHYNAARGGHASSNHKAGRRGKDRLVKVPVGTIVKDLENDLVIRDLDRAGEKVIVARGGAGGKGNSKSSEATRGEEGETRTLALELKLVADAGIIGFPNAGKSTLISKISKAHSKVAPYPFTTKSPKLGMVKYHESSFVMADMPGLIEGAHAGRGLGDRFLRHIERTMILVHLVDIVPLDGTDPLENYYKLEEELRLYGENVHGKPRIIVANKMDLPGAEDNLKIFKAEVGEEVLPVSALTGEGLGELVKAVYEGIKNVREERFEEDNDQGRDQGPDGQP